MSGDGCRVLLLVLAAPLLSLSDPPALGVSAAYSTARSWPRPLMPAANLALRGGGMLHDTPPMDFHGFSARAVPVAPHARARPTPPARYPNSYSARAGQPALAPSPLRARDTNSYSARAGQPALAPSPLRARDTPWKGASTPHYIHARTAPTLAPDHDGLQAFGEVVTVEATAQHTASVIWLHGLGDTGHTWSAVASWLQMPWCKFIFPTAPAQPVSMKQVGYAMPSWFDFDSLDMEHVDEDTETMERSVSYLHDMIAREVRSGVPHNRIMLAGFAQGGVVALVAALRCRYRIGGVLALSSWLPRNFFRRSNDLSQAARALPIWFYHGTDDKVVKYEMGWDSYQHALDLGLKAQFKCYDGLGHEYASQEMSDVQSFFFRRIPCSAAEAVPEPSPAPHQGTAGDLVQPLPRGARQRLTVGGVASHFNAPWHYAISHGTLRAAGLEVLWKDCQGGTGAMTQALDKGALDMAVLSTDGAVAEIAQGADFKIVAPFVSTPLKYGVFVWAGQREIQKLADLEGQVFAVSRKGSLSHIMTYLHAQQGGWNPRNWDRTGSSFVSR
jgi:predicted esterase